MLNPGQILFDDYRIDDFIDTGRFGIVYRASELLTGRTVAIKVAPKEPSPDFSVEDALAEGRLWRSLTGSPHVVQLFAVKRGPEDGQVSFVMEYMGGGNLAHRPQKGALPLEEVRRIAEALCGAVGYAHSRVPKVRAGSDSMWRLAFSEWVKMTFDIISESSARFTVQGVCNPDDPEDTSRVYLLLGESITLGGEPGCGILIEGSPGRAVKLMRRGDQTFFEMALDEGGMSSAVLRALRLNLEFTLGSQSLKVEPYRSIP